MPEPIGDGAEIARLHVLGQLRRHAEGIQRLEQHVDLFLFGFAMHAIQRAHAAFLELARHRHVGEDHALLDELVRLVAFVQIDALDAPGGVDVELGLGRVELQRATLVTRLEQRAIHLEQRQQLVGERAELGAHFGLAFEQRRECLACRSGGAAERMTAG